MQAPMDVSAPASGPTAAQAQAAYAAAASGGVAAASASSSSTTAAASTAAVVARSRGSSTGGASGSGSAGASSSLLAASAAASAAPPPLPWEPRSINLYKRESMTLIGEGTYGSVWLARSPNGTKVALKKIRKEKKEGFPITAIREIKLLKALRHPNIVCLKDVVSSHMPGKEGDVFMVFEFMDHDLTGLLESKVQLSDAVCKFYLRSILEGLCYLHHRQVLHRDIKGANILVSNDGSVKIADMGLARSMAKGGYTNRVVTLWYRAPELLLGSSDYDSKIDMWSMGCLMAELLTRGSVLFPGNSTELDQLSKIYDVCGTPDETSWPGVGKLKYFQQFTPKPKNRVLKSLFANQRSKHAVDLLDKLLALNPADRLSAEQALDHEYFFEEPLAIEPHQHPTFQGNNHEYGSKQRRRGREGGANNNNNSKVAPPPQQQQGGGGGAATAAASTGPGGYDRLHVVPHAMGSGMGGFQQMMSGGGGNVPHHYGQQQQQQSHAAGGAHGYAGGGGGGGPSSGASQQHPPPHAYHNPPYHQRGQQGGQQGQQRGQAYGHGQH